VNFAYVELGEKHNALVSARRCLTASTFSLKARLTFVCAAVQVKLRLCHPCAYKLNYKKIKELKAEVPSLLLRSSQSPHDRVLPAAKGGKTRSERREAEAQGGEIRR
jgi:hypothetical protein